MVYGDASEIVTELNAGTTGDSLVMGATLPEWGSAGVWQNLGTFTESSLTTNIDTGTLASHDWYKVLYDISTDASASSGAHTSLTINGSATGYTTNGATSTGSAFSNSWVSGNDYRVNLQDFYNNATNSEIGEIMIVPSKANSLTNGTQFRTTNASCRENSGGMV